MARSPRTFALAADAITVEGALIAPAMLARVAAREAERQSDADYRIPKGLTLRDEIARYFRIGQALFAEFNASNAPSVAKTINFVEALLRDVFGISDITRIGSRAVGDRLYAVTLEGLSGRVPVIVVPPSDTLDRASDHLPTDGRRRSAATAVQDWLNAQEGALWGICGNGERLRLVRDNASLTRPAYIEADLRQIFDAESFADFTVLWLLIHATRFGAVGTPASDCALERWRDAGGREGAAARERLRDGVEAALKALGTGFLASNSELRRRVQDSDLPLSDFFGQLLRLVYRLIFLLAAEDRGLLHAPDASPATRTLYGHGYSLSSLRDRAVRRTAWDSHHDKWEGLMVVFTALARGEKLLGLPALGGLFGSDMTPDLDTAHLTNRALMEAIFRLAWLREDAGLVPVNWRDMETEELGSVYESLLELTPQLVENGRSFRFAEGSETKGNARKTTGSYYTPDSLVQELLDSALDPVLDRVENETDDVAGALLRVTVIDLACGSGHFLLAAARRIATRLARLRAGGVASADDFRHALRDVARECIRGVDRNPMAVELCRVALWIETIEPGKPLTFLDSHIRCGDSLVGVIDLKSLQTGLPDDAFRPIDGDTKEATTALRKLNKAERETRPSLDLAGPPRELFEALRSLDAMPEDDVDQIDEKRRRFSSLRNSELFRRIGQACDLWTAAFVAKKDKVFVRGREEVPTTDSVWQCLRGASLNDSLAANSAELSRRYNFFHWPIEFPELIGRTGFDVVLGNPPWDKIQPEEKGFFAAVRPEIATAESAKVRKAMIEALPETDPAAHLLWTEHKRRIDGICHFLGSAKQLTLSVGGNLNTYRIFAELSSRLVSDRGRCGLVLQTGLATDESGKEIFDELMSKHRLVRFLDFENRLKFFPDVHPQFRFALVTIAGPGGAAKSSQTEFGWLLHDLAEIDEPQRIITLSADDILLFNPDSRTGPVFVSQDDLELGRVIYRRGAHIWTESGSRFGDIEFLGELFNLTRDSGFFQKRAATRQAGVLPLYEAKYIHQYDHRFATTVNGSVVELQSELKTDRHQLAITTSVVDEAEVRKRLRTRKITTRWLCGFRDIASATNERTAIMSIFPESAVGNSINLVLGLSAKATACLLANVNSFVFDFCCRQKVSGTHVNIWIFKQLPTIPLEKFSAPCEWSDGIETLQDWLLPRVLELVYTADNVEAFAADCGSVGEPFRWDDDRRAELRSEIDAAFFHLYLGNEDEWQDQSSELVRAFPSRRHAVEHILDTFPITKRKEEYGFGKFRSKILILKYFDAISKAVGTQSPYKTTINPPPGDATYRHPAIEAGSLVSLPTEAWARQGQLQAGDTGAALVALLKAMPGPMPVRTVRFAAALMLEPRLAMPLLSDNIATQWRRLVGPEANSLPANVAMFATRVNAFWGAAVRNLRGNGRLLEDLNDGTWAPGSGLEAINTSGWPDGRAKFVLNLMKSTDLTTTERALPDEIQRWIADVAAV